MFHPHHLHQEEVAAVVVAAVSAAAVAAEEVGLLLDSVVVEEHLLTPMHLIRARNTYVIRSNSNPMGSRGISRQEYNQLCRRGSDPLAQTFRVTDDTGIFVTSVDVYFSSVDDTDFQSSLNSARYRMVFQQRISCHLQFSLWTQKKL